MKYGFPSVSNQDALVESAITRKGKVILFTDKSDHKCRHYKINFDSPHTQEAASKLGITLTDCIKLLNLLIYSNRPKETFFSPGIEKKIALLKYNHHCQKVEDKIRYINDLREEICTPSN